jgi:hypothetical protein
MHTWGCVAGEMPNMACGRGCIRDDASLEICRIWHAGGDAYRSTHRGRDAEYGMQEGMHTRVRIMGEMA